jgi:hypothetical protein
MLAGHGLRDGIFEKTIMPTNLIHRIGSAAATETIHRALTTAEDVRVCCWKGAS